jgi:hypothetical protein
MYAKVYIFETVGDPWYKIMGRDSYTAFYNTIKELEKRCMEFISENDRIVEINAYDVTGYTLLINLVKSEKRKA